MRTTFLAGAAALAMIASPQLAIAQAAMSGAQTTADAAVSEPMVAPDLSPEQQAIYDAWTADRQTDYDSWPAEYQTYYWSLADAQQEGYWALTPDQRGQIYQMTPEQRATAWNSVMEQLAGRTPTTPMAQANPPGEGMPTAGVPDPQMAAQSVRPAMPADEAYQGGPYKGALTPPPATAMNKDYPVCSAAVKDNCRNPNGV